MSHGTTVEARGWIKVVSSGDASVFYKAPVIRTEGDQPRVWVRVERTTPDAAFPHFLSKASLLEYDCAGGKFRVLQSTLYTGNNQSGRAWIGARDPWTQFAPGTVGDAMRKVVCGDP